MKNIVLFLCLSFCLFSCNKEITLTLPPSPNRLVIEGRIEKVKDLVQIEQQIVLSTLNDFFNPEQVSVNNAQVSVSDTKGGLYEYLLDPNQPGRFVNNNLIPEINETYTLHVTWNREQYEASATLMAVSSLNNVYQKFEAGNTFEDEGIKIAIDFSDPIGQDNFYFWELFSDGENVVLPDPGNGSNLIAKDVFWNGQEIQGYFPNEEKIFEPGSKVKVRHIGISAVYYDYLLILFQQTGQTGQFFDVPPALVKGNIRNLTMPENIAMGYFGASEIDEWELEITE